jgi:hypothetical protein
LAPQAITRSLGPKCRLVQGGTAVNGRRCSGGAAPGRARLPFKKADAVGAQGAAQESPLPRSRVRIGRGRLPTAAHEPSGFGTGVLAALEDGGAGDQGRLVAFGSLYEALTAGGEVVDDLGRVQAQAVEID